MTLISKKTNCGEENRESMGVGQQLCSMASTVASHSCTTYHFAALQGLQTHWSATLANNLKLATANCDCKFTRLYFQYDD
jgi:hypothetical protein